MFTFEFFDELQSEELVLKMINPDCELYYKVNFTTATQDLEFDDDFKIFPNPFKEILSIISTAEIKRLSLYDMRGNELMVSQGRVYRYKYSCIWFLYCRAGVRQFYN